MTPQEERASRIMHRLKVGGLRFADDDAALRLLATEFWEAEQESAGRMRERCAAAIEQHASDHAWLYAAGAEAVRVIRSQALEGGS